VAVSVTGEKTSIVIERRDSEDFTEHEVLFATNRQPTGLEFGSERSSTLHHGVDRVSVSNKQRLFSPTRWETKIKKHERKLMTEDEFYQCLSKSADGSVLVFIHGFNTSFDECICRAAQIKKDLKIAAIIAFSWPSIGVFPERYFIEHYPADRETIRLARFHIADFLSALSTRARMAKIHVLAYSMGNIGLLNAISEQRTDALRLEHLIFAAPDVDQDEFRVASPRVVAVARSVTLYVSSNDWALTSSSHVHRVPRAGDGREVLVVPDVTTIDASAAGGKFMNFLGHGYVTNSRNVLSDIYSLLEGTPPARRFGLKEETSSLGTYWRVLP
jgi:esterase/lipase superfamily enzyme